MKVALLAGGLGTRLSEETTVRPKPMVEIGGRPIMWHIMKMYAHYGHKDFVILGGYKVDYIRKYFLRHQSTHYDFSICLKTGDVEWLQAVDEDWRVTVLDTGAESMTGGRLRRARHLLDRERFCLTYGDGVSDVNIKDLIAAHAASDAWCTLTAVTPPGRYRALQMSDDKQVTGFYGKGSTEGGLINGGFFVCEPQIFDLIDGDQTVFEAEPMDRMIKAGKLGSYAHTGHWQSMDSLRDKQVLEAQWAAGAPWKVW